MSDNNTGSLPKTHAERFCPYCMSPIQPGQSCPVCGLTDGNYTPAPHHLPPGTVLDGRFLVGRVLGEGGFGITYIGCDLRLEMKVAIKEYYPADRVVRYAANSPEVTPRHESMTESYQRGLRRFLAEARTMAQMVKTPEIVTVRDHFEENNTAYIVMEYVEGTDFAALTKQRGGRIAPSELFRLMEPLFGALSAMHEKGLIHRDISPDNLMLEDGHVRLLDFGCARETDPNATEPSSVVVKHGYAPLEQYYPASGGQGPWTDVYALAGTIYYCLTGRVPPQGRVLEDTLIPPRDLGVDISPAQEKALLKALEIKPNQRWQTVDEFHSALYNTGSAPAPRPKPQPEPKPKPEPQPESEPQPVDKNDPVTRPVDGILRTRGKEEKQKPRKYLPAAILTGSLAVIAVALFALFGGGGNPEPAPEVTWEMPDTEAVESLFDAAVTAVTMDELRDALTDPSVAAVNYTGGFESLLASRELPSVTKPLCVDSGVELYLADPLRVGGGGMLYVKGAVDGSPVVTEDGGGITLESGGSLSSDVYVSGADNWTGPEPAGRVFVLPENSADAVAVSTFSELVKAAEAGDAPILITGSIVLEETVAVCQDVIVAAGAGLYLPEDYVYDEIRPIELLIDNSESFTSYSLLNYGEVRCGVNIGTGGGVVNYGLLGSEVGIWLGDYEADYKSGFMVNLGTLELSGYNVLWCDTVNCGEINVGSAQFTQDGADFYNSGALTIAPGGQALLGGSTVNSGSVTVEAGNGTGGGLELSGDFMHLGSLSAQPGADIVNYGVLDAFDEHSFDLADGTLDSTDGVVLTRDMSGLEEAFSGGGALYVDYDVIDGALARGEYTMVYDEWNLLSAMEDPNAGLVVVDGPVSVSGSLTVRRPMYITGSGSLTLPDNGTFTVEDTVVSVNGDLKAWTITVDGGMLELSTYSDTESMSAINGGWLYTHWESAHSCESLSASGGGTLVFDSGDPESGEGYGSGPKSVSADGGTIVLRGEDNRWLSRAGVTAGGRFIATTDLAAGPLSVTDGTACMLGSTSLSAVNTEIGKNGRLISRISRLHLNSEGTLNNAGSLEVWSLTDLNLVIEGTINNSGTILVSDRMNLSGTINNTGTILHGGSAPADNPGNITGPGEVKQYA